MPDFTHELFFEDCEFTAPVGDTTRNGISLSTLGSITEFEECVFSGQQSFFARVPNQVVTFSNCKFKDGDIGGYGVSGEGSFLDYYDCYFTGGRITTLANSTGVTWHRIFNSLIKSGNFYFGAGARVEIYNSTLAGSATNSSIFSLDNSSKILKLFNCVVLSGYLNAIAITGASPTVTLINTIWKNGGGYSLSGNMIPFLGNFTSESAFGTGVTSSPSSFNVNIISGIQL
jgi:hypothetical protein